MNWIQILSSSLLPVTYFVLNVVAICYICKAIVVAATFCFAFVGTIVSKIRGK